LQKKFWRGKHESRTITVKDYFMKKIFYSLCLIFFLNVNLLANDIQVSNIKLTGQNSLEDYTLVQFDLQWENSWRTSSGPANGDVAWIFVKYRVGTSDFVLTDASSSGTTITVISTANLRVGMPVYVTSGTGLFADNTVISSITNPTEFVVSIAPTTPLSGATVTAYRFWQHAKLNNTGNSTGSGTDAMVQVGLVDESIAFNASTNPAVGAFFYRSADGSGTFSITGAQLRWNYGENDVSDADVVYVKVFAIEMVYVPQGSFYVGDGTTNTIEGHFRDGASNTPFQITSEAAITLGGTSLGNLSNSNGSGMNESYPDDFNDAITQTLPAGYPKGFDGFCCMKYELAQHQWVEFLNTLTRSQQNTRTETDLSPGITSVTNRWVMVNASGTAHHQGIRCNATIPAYEPITIYNDLNGNNVGNEDGDAMNTAMININPMDKFAFADWCGLRIMTELEYEKSCRGVVYPVPDEYAFGSTAIIPPVDRLYMNTKNEIASNDDANVNYDNVTAINGPIRVGAFAKSNTTRQQSGASYYGIMDLSGNMHEMTINVGTPEGRAYTGNHGDGELSVNGNANVINWPGMINGEVTERKGVGVRGGSYVNDNNVTRVSDRRHAATYVYATVNRGWYVGVRAVRSLASTPGE